MKSKLSADLEQCRSALEALAWLAQDLLDAHPGGIAGALAALLAEDAEAAAAALAAREPIKPYLVALNSTADRLQADGPRAGIAAEAPGLAVLTWFIAGQTGKAAA